MHIFYTPHINGKTYAFPEEEAAHCLRVLRMDVGRIVNLIDGKGGFYTAKIKDIDKNSCTVEIIDKKTDFEKRNYKLSIAIAPTKNIERFEWFLEKSTEIGIDEIVPICCNRSERKNIKTERCQKIIISAAKQSVKAYLPKLTEMVDFKKVITSAFDGKKLIAHCEDAEKILLKNAVSPSENVLVLIGPEGDFSPKEIALAKERGFMEISLGKSRLRTETAGVYACTTVCIVNENG